MEPVWIVATISCSSAAVAHLLQGSTCFAFRDGILHTLVVTSGYLSYCCISIISNQSAHSPLTSDIDKAFSSTQLPLTGYFLFFWPFSVNPKDGCAWKSQEISSFWNTQTSPSGTNKHSSFKILFLPHSDARFELQQVVFTTSRCLNALSCCQVIGWLSICVTKQLNRCT